MRRAFSYLAGLETSALTAPGATLSDQSALLTFYSHTNTDRVMNNGPIQVIDRSGEVTFYVNATPAGNCGEDTTGEPSLNATLTLEPAPMWQTLSTVSGHAECLLTKLPVA